MEDQKEQTVEQGGNHVVNTSLVELNTLNRQHKDQKVFPMKNKTASICLKSTSILILLIGLLVSILNIIFIYFGMHSNWYNGNAGILKVISVGEGIIAGVFYIILSLILLVFLSRKSLFAAKMIILCNSFLIVISFTLSIVNGCQIGMVETFFPGNFETEEAATIAYKERQDQMGVLGVQMASHMVVLVTGAANILGASKLFRKK